MQIKRLFSYLLLFLYPLFIKPEGFLPNTFVKTTSGYSYIERLKPKNIIFSHLIDTNQPHHAVITQNTISTSDHYLKITVDDLAICCAPDQKFYAYNQEQWITADQLKITDFLMNDEGEAIAIDSIDHIKKDCIFYALSLKTDHIYYISHHNILVHNTIPVVVISIPVIVSTVTPIVETLLAAAGTCLGVHFITKKFKHKQHASLMNSSSSNNYESYYPDPNDPNNDDKNKRNDKEHAHGIYKDAPYHHKNSSARKSQCPKDGQRCLDYSLPTETNQRIAIEGKNFILLKYTSLGNYHGHIIEWKELDHAIRRILIKHGFVKNSGKIIRQITEKCLL